MTHCEQAIRLMLKSDAGKQFAYENWPHSMQDAVLKELGVEPCIDWSKVVIPEQGVIEKGEPVEKWVPAECKHYPLGARFRATDGKTGVFVWGADSRLEWGYLRLQRESGEGYAMLDPDYFEVFIPEPTKVWQKAELKEYPKGTEFRVVRALHEGYENGEILTWGGHSCVGNISAALVLDNAEGQSIAVYPSEVEVLA